MLQSLRGGAGVLDQDDGVALQTSMDLEDPPPDIETLMESVVKVSLACWAAVSQTVILLQSHSSITRARPGRSTLISP